VVSGHEQRGGLGPVSGRGQRADVRSEQLCTVGGREQKVAVRSGWS